MPVSGASRQPTSISRLKLADFRNYASLSLDLSPGLVVFSGDNGAGKTNLLEAISLLSPGRGLRRATYEEIGRNGAVTGFAVHALLEGSFGTCEIGTGTGGRGSPPGRESEAETGRRVRINQGAAAAEDLLDWLRVLWLTPAMDALFTGPGGDRRRFLDRLVLAIDPGHGRRTLRYERAMRGRNRLLADGSRDRNWFEAIETEMAESGVAIAAARTEMAHLLSATIDRISESSPFPQAGLELSGSIETMVGEMAAVEVEQRFRGMLAAGRDRDRAAGRTLEGPHRADLRVHHRPKSMPAELCSTGEQKALLVGLMLAHAQLSGEISGKGTILLLDEIAAHLDSGLRAALFDMLEGLGSQTFMTGTDAELFSSLRGRARFLAVDHGHIEPASTR
jgi:DNA replication and repair protein RecF